MPASAAPAEGVETTAEHSAISPMSDALQTLPVRVSTLPEMSTGGRLSANPAPASIAVDERRRLVHKIRRPKVRGLCSVPTSTLKPAPNSSSGAARGYLIGMEVPTVKEAVQECDLENSKKKRRKRTDRDTHEPDKDETTRNCNC